MPALRASSRTAAAGQKQSLASKEVRSNEELHRIREQPILPFGPDTIDQAITAFLGGELSSTGSPFQGKLLYPTEQYTVMERCPWCESFEFYRQYHDREWGVPLYDERALFELLILEGAQAGLSWATILKKRDNYRAAFDGFDPVRMAAYDEAKVADLLADPGIVRNRAKVAAAIQNARAFLALTASGRNFSDFLWQFVGDVPIQNAWSTLAEVPAKTPESDAMSKALSKAGFKFVGSTICYAFMQSAGMVNDHLIGCFRHQQVKGSFR